ncbi:hypothetical protein K8I31_09935, partial [bacterium]|nr:hypothetical protein [bacterium]
MKPVIRYFTTIFIALIILCAYSSANEIQPFNSAKPIWPQGRETEKNLCVGFRADVNLSAKSLMRGQASFVRLTASTLYRLFVNGQFIGCGPARGPHGYYRVDEWDVSDALQPGENWIAVEVAGYNANSYYLLDQPSFLQAEWQQGAQTLAATSGDGEAFKALRFDSRIEKVQRYSFQRPFI